jgi:hypothetical protein
MKTLTKFTHQLVWILVLASVSGCLPIPHTTDRSGELTGRVLDAHTHLPIEGAKVSFVKKPHHLIFTDATGHFDLQPTRNFHWAYVPPEGDWPQGKDNVVTVSHPNYSPQDLLPYMVGNKDVGDILLNPKQ